jgi:hypothetical protein
MIHTMQLTPAMYGSKLSPHEWNSMMAHEIQQHARATASTVDPMVCALLVACALAIVAMLMIKHGPQNSFMTQRGRATPEPRVPNAAALNDELRRQMTMHLGREPTIAELDDERRRRAYLLFTIEHGFSPLSPDTTPHQSPIVEPESDDEQAPPTPEHAPEQAPPTPEYAPEYLRDYPDLAALNASTTTSKVPASM